MEMVATPILEWLVGGGVGEKKNYKKLYYCIFYLN